MKNALTGKNNSMFIGRLIHNHTQTLRIKEKELPKTAMEMISSAFLMSSKAKSAVEDAAILYRCLPKDTLGYCGVTVRSLE